MIKLTLLVLYSGMGMYMGYTTLAPFFPGEIMSRGLSPLFNSAIFGIYAFSYILISNFTASFCIPKLGRVTVFIIGCIMLSVTIYIFGFLYYVQNSYAFITITLVTRLIQGCGAAIILVTGFAIIVSVYPKSMGMITAFNQIGIRLGLTLGPLFGSFLYRWVGFVGPFFFVATLTLPPIFIKCFIDTSLIPDGRVNQSDAAAKKKIKLCNRRAVFAYYTFCLSMMKLAVLETTISDKLMIDFGFTADKVALYLFAYTGASTLVCFFMPLIPQRLDKRYLMVPANLICGFSAFLIGPSTTLGITNTSQTVLVGLIIGGCLGAVVPCFVVAEAITATLRYISQDQHSIMVNQVSGYRTFFHGFGILVGPIVGGVLMYYFGFPRMMEVVGLVFILTGITDVSFIIIEHKQEKKEKDEQLKAQNLNAVLAPESEEARLLPQDESNNKEELKQFLQS